MPSKLSQLSVDEIRERYARADAPVSPQTLSKLKRDPRHGVRLIYATLKKRYERDSAERTRLDAMLNFERVFGAPASSTSRVLTRSAWGHWPVP